MKPQIRLLLALMAFLVIGGILLARRDATPPMLAASYSGLASIPGPVHVGLSISPPIGSPRDTMQLDLRVTNNTPSIVSPQIRIQLPSMLQLESGHLPAGVTANLADNSLQWLPIAPASGGGDTLTLPLKVASADLTRPEQVVSIQLTSSDNVLSASAPIWIGIPPRVEKFENATHIAVGQPIEMIAKVQGPGPFTESWDLGDGRRVAVQSPTVVYPVAGVYDVAVKVRNPVGEATYSSQLTVVPHVNAAFMPEDDTPSPGQVVAFNNLGGGQQPVQYQWDFGDGNVSTEAQPAHAFGAPGTYSVKLIATNAFGVSEETQTVTVGLPPEAEIVVAERAPAGTHLDGQVVVARSDKATDFSWEMGDGKRYDSAKINHAYRQSGDYYVTMTASNEFGETQVGRWIHVEEGVLQAYMPMVTNFGGLVQGSSTDSNLAPGSAPAEEYAIDAPFVMDPQVFAAVSSPQERLLAYINEARASFELPELAASQTLSIAAQKHADDMAAAKHNKHTGSDGSLPSERFLQHGYANAYAGEATAWGFIDPRQAVEFWVNSPSHRSIILNPWATEVGLGYTVDYQAPSVWYWTAEFGNASGEAESPVLRVQAPAANLEVLNSEKVSFIWNWPVTLAAAEQFTVYLNSGSGPIAVGTVTKPVLGTQYRVSFEPLAFSGLVGEFQWQVRLENNRGAELLSSELRPMKIDLDPTLPTATPLPSPTPTVLPTLQPTASPTLAPTTQPPTPRPTEPPLPPLVTATPLPLATP